ncbi:MAG: iron-containing alcohol dehydrogenase, partial [Paracoccaceae bacterium]
AAAQAAAPALKGATVYDRTPSNPTEAAAQEALKLYRAAKCDGLVAIGGGSPIDLAKTVGLMATHDGPLARYAAIDGGVGRIGPIAPVIAVPTTAGTGSEVGRAALITLADGRKLGLISPHLIPSVALCDPDLTLGLPAGLTAATGLDAISHCVETYLSPRVNPVAEAIALDGLETLVATIERAVANGGDKAARWSMMMGALQGGLTFQKGLGAIHALSHPLGGLKRISLHHGALNAILLPHVLDWNEQSCAGKYAKIRARLGLAKGASLSGFFADLNARLNLPATLGAIGVEAGDLEPVSRAAVLDHSSATNPRSCSEADYLRLLTDAL